MSFFLEKLIIFGKVFFRVWQIFSRINDQNLKIICYDFMSFFIYSRECSRNRGFRLIHHLHMLISIHFDSAFDADHDVLLYVILLVWDQNFTFFFFFLNDCYQKILDVEVIFSEKYVPYANKWFLWGRLPWEGSDGLNVDSHQLFGVTLLGVTHTPYISTMIS